MGGLERLSRAFGKSQSWEYSEPGRPQGFDNTDTAKALASFPVLSQLLVYHFFHVANGNETDRLLGLVEAELLGRLPVEHANKARRLSIHLIAKVVKANRCPGCDGDRKVWEAKKNRPCRGCDGLGIVKHALKCNCCRPGSEPDTNCTNCGGSGIFKQVRRGTCQACRGTGRRDIRRVNCPKCKGCGFVSVSNRYIADQCDIPWTSYRAYCTDTLRKLEWALKDVDDQLPVKLFGEAYEQRSATV